MMTSPFCIPFMAITLTISIVGWAEDDPGFHLYSDMRSSHLRLKNSERGFIDPKGKENPRKHYYNNDSWKSFITGFDSLPLSTSGFPNMLEKPHSRRSPPWLFIGFCLFLSLFGVLAPRGIYTSPHYIQLHDMLSRSLGISSLDSESSTTTTSTVTVLESTTRSDQVQFDNHSLILRGQRIFL